MATLTRLQERYIIRHQIKKCSIMQISRILDRLFPRLTPLKKLRSFIWLRTTSWYSKTLTPLLNSMVRRRDDCLWFLTSFRFSVDDRLWSIMKFLSSRSLQGNSSSKIPNKRIFSRIFSLRKSLNKHTRTSSNTFLVMEEVEEHIMEFTFLALKKTTRTISLFSKKKRSQSSLRFLITSSKSA